MLLILILAFIAITDPSTDCDDNGPITAETVLECSGRISCSTITNLDFSGLDEKKVIGMLKSMKTSNCPFSLTAPWDVTILEFEKLENWETRGDVTFENTKLKKISFGQLKKMHARKLALTNNMDLMEIKFSEDSLSQNSIKFEEVFVCQCPSLNVATRQFLKSFYKYTECEQNSEESAETKTLQNSWNGWIITAVIIILLLIIILTIYYRNRLVDVSTTILSRLRNRNIAEIPIETKTPSVFESILIMPASFSCVDSEELLQTVTEITTFPEAVVDSPRFFAMFPCKKISSACQNDFTDFWPSTSTRPSVSPSIQQVSVASQTESNPSDSTSNILESASQTASTKCQTSPKSFSRTRAFSPVASIVFGKFATTSLLPRDLLSSYKTKERRITPLPRTIKDQILSAPSVLPAPPVVDEAGPSSSQVAAVPSYSQKAVSTEFDLNSFQFHKVLGQGSFGECLLGSHKQLGFVVAKLFLDHFRKPIQAVEESPAHFYIDSELKEDRVEKGTENLIAEEGEDENQPGYSGLGLKEEEKENEWEDTSRMELGKILMELEGEEDDDEELGGGIAGPSCSARRDGNGEAYPSYIEENDDDFEFELEKKTEENKCNEWKEDFVEHDCFGSLEDADYETEEQDYFVDYEEEWQFHGKKDVEENRNGSEIDGNFADFGTEGEEEAIAGASYCWGTCLETIEEEDEEEDQTPGPSSCYSEDDSETVDSMNRWEEEEHRNNWESNLEMNQNLSEMDAEYASVYYEVKYEEEAAACSIYWYMKGAQDSQIGQELETDGQYYLEDEIAGRSWGNLKTIEEEEEGEEDEDEEDNKIEEEEAEEQKPGPSCCSEDDSDYPSQLEYKGPSRRQMEERELELSILLKGHTNIVKFHGLIYRESPEKIVGFVMEPLMGGDLHGTIFGNEELEEKLVNTWMVHLARAIAFLQKKCVIHRDIKPENILLTEDRRILKLADFGYAKMKVAGQRNTIRITNLMYCAPEIYLDKEYTKMADIYSYGMCLYAMFYRRKPYSRNLNMFSVETARYLQDNSTRPDLHGKLMDGLIASCWDGNPEKRPTIRQIVDKLDRQWRQLIPRYE